MVVEKTGVINRGIKDENLPPAILDNELGESETFKQVDGKWVHSTEADVVFQERKVLVEYDKLDLLKEKRDAYKKRIEEALKNKK